MELYVFLVPCIWSIFVELPYALKRKYILYCTLMFELEICFDIRIVPRKSLSTLIFSPFESLSFKCISWIQHRVEFCFIINLKIFFLSIKKVGLLIYWYDRFVWSQFCCIILHCNYFVYYVIVTVFIWCIPSAFFLFRNRNLWKVQFYSCGFLLY